MPHGRLRAQVARHVLIEDGGNAVIDWCRYGEDVYLFKRFREEHRNVVDEAALVRLVLWRRSLPPDRRSRLDTFTAWPRYVVRDGDGRVAGVLIPAAGHRFFRATWDGRLTPRGLYVLLGVGGRPGVPVPERIRVLARLIGAVRWLHRCGVVVNDLQPENLLYSVDGRDTAVYIVDCDSMVSVRHWGRVAPPAAPDLMTEVLPAGTEPTVEADLTKLFWLVTRVVLDDPSVTGLGARDEAELFAAVPGHSRGHLSALVRDPTDAAAWDALVEAWHAAPPSPPPQPPEPLAQRQDPGRGWLPPGWSYRPAPGPPVLPARLRGGPVLPGGRALAMTALVGCLAGLASLLSVLAMALLSGGR